jgi:hypothetical protein
VEGYIDPASLWERFRTPCRSRCGATHTVKRATIIRIIRRAASERRSQVFLAEELSAKR